MFEVDTITFWKFVTDNKLQEYRDPNNWMVHRIDFADPGDVVRGYIITSSWNPVATYWIDTELVLLESERIQLLPDSDSVAVSDLTVNFEPERYALYFTDKEGKSLLTIKHNGDIYVRDKLTENDKEVVDALREFLKDRGYLNNGDSKSHKKT